MTARPESLLDRIFAGVLTKRRRSTDDAGDMDPLSDVLHAVRLNGAFFYLVEACEPWSVAAATARELAPHVLPQAEHLVSYHIVTAGGCWGGLQREGLLRLEAGDVILFPQGDPHFMSSHPTLISHPEEGAAPARHLETVVLGEGTPCTRFVCGFLGCDARPFNPLLSALPRCLHVPGGVDGWLVEFPRQAVAESRRSQAGAGTILTRLAELMFIEVVRRHIETLAPQETGWLAGLRDDVVGRALACMHERPSEEWSLISLARSAAVSRTVLADRFTELVGIPPMQYLTHWRIQLAAKKLSQSAAKVATIAEEAGYDSEAAFSRAFKRATGLAPSAYRRARQS